ncbi:MAG: hypothetical protein K1X94_18355 [Sandaracinaceae bacterium]|nr:hypothetical protein [Sandaracinaceae bacterium]
MASRRCLRSLAPLSLAASLSLFGSVARAQSLVAAPDDPAHDAALASHIDGIARVQDAVLSRPVGFGLEAYTADEGHRATIASFVASGESDFVAATGQHPYAVIDAYGEQGDLGMFGGVQAAGLAWRYVVLRDHGGTPEEIGRAREALLRAIEGLHWFTAVTGEPGCVVRGLMRVTPEDGEPPLPGERPSTLPLLDAMGMPQPADKVATWREDRSGSLPFLVWMDDTSKDQLDGYVLALGAVYDAIQGDEAFDASLTDRLREDATAIARRLMRRVAVTPTEMADLVIVDADGRPTRFHDLSAEEVTPGLVVRRPTNGFNALMALGVMRTLYHIGGDPEVGRYYYEELVGNRDYLATAELNVRLMYQGLGTNYSNVNMAFVAAYGVLRYETDPVIQGAVREVLETSLYAPDVDREARGLGLPFFDFLYAGFRSAGASDAAASTAIGEGLATLNGYRSAPLWDEARINCDEGEIAAGSCLAVDGTTTITLAPDLGRLGTLVAVDPVPIAIRPPSNFEHRSDPHRVNGDGGSRLDPGGDIVAAYWLGQLLSRTSPDDNVSSHAREPLPWTPASARDAGVPPVDAASEADAGSAVVDAGAVVMPPSGCGCRAGRGARSWVSLCLAGLALALARGSRSRRTGAR